MTSRPHEDDDFAEFVRARQHQLVRAAYLLCGDETRAVELARAALADLALQWRQAREEGPDAAVRRALYGRAAARRSARTAPASPQPLPAAEVVRALSHLTGRQRAVVVLRHLEQRGPAETAQALGTSVGAVRGHEDAARRRLRELLPDLAGDLSDDQELARGLAALLERATFPVDEVELLEGARHGARELRRRRRRTGLVVATAVLAAVAAAAVVPRGAQPEVGFPRTPTTGTQTAGTGWDGATIEVLGVPAQVGPAPEELASVPRIDDLTRGQLALPEVLAFGPETQIPLLSELGPSSAPVRAVLLRHTADGLRAVLVRPTLGTPLVLVDTLPLVMTLDEGGNAAEPLEVGSVAGDRRHVLFVQPGKVHVLDAYTGEVRTTPVADRHLENGGWVGTAVIVWSDTYRWRVTPETGEVRRVAATSSAGRHEVRVDGTGLVRVIGYDERGVSARVRTGPAVLSQVWGRTFTNLDSTVATGGFLSEAAALEANRQRPARLFQGVLTTDAERPQDARLLIAPGSEGVRLGCCEVLGWAYRDQVLVRWNGADLLLWDTRTGDVRRVSTLPTPDEEPSEGSAAASVALAP